LPSRLELVCHSSLRCRRRESWRRSARRLSRSRVAMR
jgi:hypothetical protein